MSTIYLIDHYANNLNSPIHRASALSKIIGAALALGTSMLTDSVIALMVDFLIILMMILLARLSPFRMLKWAIYPAFFASIFAVSQLPSSFIRPLATMLKAINSALIMLFIASTTPYPELFSILGNISQTIGNVAFLTYRFFFLFIDQASKRFTAMKSRGGLAGGWKKRIINMANFMGLIFVISFETSENVYSALKIRGYDGKIVCNRKIDLRLSWNDLLPFAFASCFLLVMVFSLLFKELMPA
jgi:cobalt/nickel transport system permease protein